MADAETTWEAWIAYLKSKTQLVALLNSSSEIKEQQWQGTDFLYPAVRLYIDYHPSINGCGVDNADVYIDIFSEQKSSKEAQHIASTLENILQKKQFSQNGIKFPMVWLKDIIHPNRDIYSFKSCLNIKVLVN